ncbi:AraC family transcriptional regulator [Dactylosporangium sp. CS-047395]|uniref:AraC family transcriptional regulator n=1 Tax=Dactylosporangium sp. CS-047395 TaxID=3239936 RepID=UPI003D932DBB
MNYSSFEPARPVVVDLRIHDSATLASELNRIIPHRARVEFGDIDDADVWVRAMNDDGIKALRVRLGGVHYAASYDPGGFLFAGTVQSGSIAVRSGGRDYALGRDDGLLLPMGQPIEGEYGGSTLAMLGLPMSYVAGVAEADSGIPAADLRFEGMQPVTDRMQQYWAGVAAFICGQLTSPGVSLPLLVLEHLRRLSATALLSVFPNTTLTAARLPGAGRVVPAVVRRAAAFMDAHPDRPLTVAEVASEVGVGARGLQVAFRRHVGCTPMEYLRRVRVERVHRELRDASPRDGVTVRATAQRWGFANPGRFSALYRSVYGQPPSRTLRL